MQWADTSAMDDRALASRPAICAESLRSVCGRLTDFKFARTRETPAQKVEWYRREAVCNELEGEGGSALEGDVSVVGCVHLR